MCRDAYACRAPQDRKIAKSKERAEKESAPKPVKPDDQIRLDELQQRAKGEARERLHGRKWRQGGSKAVWDNCSGHER